MMYMKMLIKRLSRWLAPMRKHSKMIRVITMNVDLKTDLDDLLIREVLFDKSESNLILKFTPFLFFPL